MEEIKKSEGSVPVKKCSHCQKEIDVNATKCPYCQSNLKSNKVAIIIFFIFLGLVAFFIFLSASSSGNNDKQAALQSCLTTAQNTYNRNWEKECAAEGDPGIDSNCKINITQATLLDNRLQSAKNDCYNAYPQ